MLMKKRHTAVLPGLAAVLTVLLAAGSLFIGKYPLTMKDLLNQEPQVLRVFMTLRLPRTCMALVGGFGLGIAGAVYQNVFHNPLASPDTIGVSSGASAGAAFGILFLSSNPAFITASAFAGGLAAVFLSLGLASIGGKQLGGSHKGPASIVLAGIAVHSLAQTILMILKLTADPERQLASIEYWIMGSLNGITLYRIPMPVLVCAVCCGLLFLLYHQVLLLSIEEEEARMLGVPVGRMRLLVLFLATLVTASIISVTGLVSFIGLLAPHTARLLTKNNRMPMLLLSGLFGSALLCMADLCARSLTASELPVSIFTSLLGAPFLLYLMFGRDSKL